MERMAGGQDTWAKWKAAMLALSPDELRSYLRDVEAFEPEQIRRFLADGFATRPEDWEVTPESQAAMARYNAWETRVADRGNEAAILRRQEARAAALPPAADDVRP